MSNDTLRNTDWTECVVQLPPDGEVVQTIISDHKGKRNEWPLKRQGNLWFMPDGSMYVYYTPTHWKPLEKGGES